MVAPFLPDAEKLAAVREALPAVGAGLYLDTPTAGPLPAETAAAMADVAAWELRTGRAGRDRRDEVLARIDEARAAVATILGAGLEEVVLCHGLGDALGRAIRTVDWRPGNRALVAPELTTTIGPLLPPGVEPVPFELKPDPESTAAADRASAAFARGVRLVACPLVSAASGARLPVEALAAAAQDRDVRLVVDVSQAAGTLALDRRELGADVIVARSEAWLLGPEGLAVIAGSPDLIDRVVDRSDASSGFHLPSVVGFARSCGWLAMYVGLEWIAATAARLAERAFVGLRSVPGVEVLAPAPATTVIVFRIAGWSAEAILDELGARIFLLAAAVPKADAVRIGTAFFNTEAEVDRLVEGVRLLANHRPETLPPRRHLAILGEGP